MRKILKIMAATAILISGTSMAATAQKNDIKKYEGHWYNGPEEFVSITASHDTISCAIGYIMDAGGISYYKHRGGNNFEYLGVYDYDAEDGILKDNNYGVICEFKITQKDGYRYLESPVFNGPDSCMIDLALYAGYFKGKTKSYYIDPDNKNSQGFSAKRCTVRCLGDNEIEEEYCGDYILHFGDMHLNTRTGSLRNSNDMLIDMLKRDYPTNAERYPFTATTVLSAQYLEDCYSVNDLQIMRNEIFARHGYIFKSDAMKKHFEAQSWYKGTQSNVNNLLNNIEQQNVATIKDVEARMNK